MIVDWRALFDALRIPWRDKGANSSRENVNIGCPWCRNDPSYHLAVSETKEAFFCFRDVRHSGHSFIGLLVKLGCKRYHAVELLNTYMRSAVPRAVAPKPVVSAAALEARWNGFLRAATSLRCVDYLLGRGFPDPAITCWQHDLRLGTGRWANRLLIPIRNQSHQLMSWTGRSIVEKTQPKYLMFDAKGEGLLFVARAPGKVLVIVEGPLDALKIAAAPFPEIGVVALLGKNMSATKLLTLEHLTRDCKGVFIALDNDVSMSQSYAIISEIVSALRGRYIRRLPIPERYKDPGEMPVVEQEQWLRGVLHGAAMVGGVL